MGNAMRGLDAFVDARTRRHGLGERVQVHDDEFEGLDAEAAGKLIMAAREIWFQDQA